MAFDDGHNVLASSDPARPATWHLFRARDIGFITAMSCPSASLCVATGRFHNAGAVLYSTRPASGRSGWKEVPANVDAISLACPDASMCVAGGEGVIFATTRPTAPGKVWTSTVIKDDGSALPVIACQSSTLCVASERLGELFTGRLSPSRRPRGLPAT